MSEVVLLMVTFDPVLVTEDFMAEHLMELEGVLHVEITEPVEAEED